MGSSPLQLLRLGMPVQICLHGSHLLLCTLQVLLQLRHLFYMPGLGILENMKCTVMGLSAILGALQKSDQKQIGLAK